MNVGIVFGCFIPLHRGHLNIIERALKENDMVIIGICGYAEDRGKDFLPFAERQRLMQNRFGDNEKVILSVVDDRKIGLTGKFDEEAWKIWSKEFFTNAKIDPEDDQYNFTWYTGDKRYVDTLYTVFPKHSFFLQARGELSGTLIRQDYRKYKNLIDEDFYEYLEGNVK